MFMCVCVCKLDVARGVVVSPYQRQQQQQQIIIEKKGEK